MCFLFHFNVTQWAFNMFLSLLPILSMLLPCACWDKRCPLTTLEQRLCCTLFSVKLKVDD